MLFLTKEYKKSPIIMNGHDYCCSVDSHGLRYPGFSVVFLQIFCLDYARDFFIPKDITDAGVITRKVKDIDSQIFTLNKTDRDSIRRFDLPGFRFEVTLDEPYTLTLKGKVFVEMSILFNHTISLSYRFVFDGNHCSLTGGDGSVCAAATDHLIALLSTHLSAEHWSRNKDRDETDINLEINDFLINGLRFSANGDLIESPDEPEVLSGEGRIFDYVSSRYKSFIVNHCTIFKKNLPADEKRLYFKRRKKAQSDSSNDLHYAMVDIWESISHPLEDGTDLFDDKREDKLSEADIVNHIRDFHKPELIGLMTLYPGEWPYRDAEAYDECCGENIAIDTDDLVLVNNSVCVVIGTYGRRGKDSPVDWEEHLKERSEYHVSWPEYLLILEMVLAKKHVLCFATDELVESTLNAENESATELIAHNAALGMRLSRMELQLDVVKYSKFTSHKVMFDRTNRRLEIGQDFERLNGMMDIVDNSLHNLSDYKSLRSDFILNFILALISVASTFELFFQSTEMPFLEYFGFEDNHFAAVFLWVVATVTFFGLLLVVVSVGKKIIRKIKSLL